MRRWMAGILCGLLWPAALSPPPPGPRSWRRRFEAAWAGTRSCGASSSKKKYIQALAKPLVSRGDFLVARERGVLWRTRIPFAQTVRLTRAGIVLEQGGETSVRLSAAREPAVQAATGVLFRPLERRLRPAAGRLRPLGAGGTGELVGDAAPDPGGAGPAVPVGAHGRREPHPRRGPPRAERGPDGDPLLPRPDGGAADGGGRGAAAVRERGLVFDRSAPRYSRRHLSVRRGEAAQSPSLPRSLSPNASMGEREPMGPIWIPACAGMTPREAT